MLELPMVICNVQRAGPSTGMPTKTEQADLMQVMYGRNGEAPCAVLAACTPTDCFDTVIEAWRIPTTELIAVGTMAACGAIASLIPAISCYRRTPIDDLHLTD